MVGQFAWAMENRRVADLTETRLVFRIPGQPQTGVNIPNGGSGQFPCIQR